MCVCFMVEYASGGSLFDYLSSAESEDISMKQIMTWAIDIAKGIIYTYTLINWKKDDPGFTDKA